MISPPTFAGFDGTRRLDASTMHTLTFRALCGYLLILTGLAGCNAHNGLPGTSDSIQATLSIPGTVAAVVGGTRTVSITFNSSDGRTLSGFAVTGGLTALPAGWKGPDGLECQSVSTGNGCLLNLAFTPAAAASGSLTIDFSYTNNAGAEETGSISIPYASTTHDNVVAAVSPTGQIAGITGGTQTVGVTFTTDDGNAASAFTVDTDLSALPAGWSAAASSFACAAVSTGSGCHLALSYAPTSAGGGTLTLSYGYHDDSGTAKTGSVSIPYTSTPHDNVLAAVSPTGTVSVAMGNSQPVSVKFTTDDGSVASSFSLTSALSALPAGWTSSAASFSCTTVSTGSACALPLTFAPSAAGTGTLKLDYGYTDDAGTAQTGSVSIAYAATHAILYVADYGGNSVLMCPTQSDGTLGTCQSTGSGFSAPEDVKITGNRLYVTNYLSSSVSVCTINANGTLSNCATAASGLTDALSIAINAAGTLAYLGSYSQPPSVCAIASNGLLSNCTSTGGIGTESWGLALSADGQYAYYSSPTEGTVDTCAIAVGGTLNSCTSTMPSDVMFGLAIYGNNLYEADLGGGAVALCALNNDDSIGSCATAASGIISPIGFAFNGNVAYVSNYSSNSISICPVNVDGTFGNCAVSTDASFNVPFGMAIR